MSMLAERRRKTKWVINPTKKPLWTTDSNGIKFGKELMEKMGWSAGKGLGAKEQGIQEPLKVSYKNDTKGMGFKGNDDDWIEQQDEFNVLLNQLRNSDDSSVVKVSEEEKNEIKSLEEKSKQSRARVHYQKFTRGKDLSRYTENDLACILGTNKIKKEKSKTEEVVGSEEKTEGHLVTSFGVTTINSGSIQDYFKKKWIIDKAQSKGVSDVEKEKEEHSCDERPSFSRVCVESLNLESEEFSKEDNKKEDGALDGSEMNGDSGENFEKKKKRKKTTSEEEEPKRKRKKTSDQDNPVDEELQNTLAGVAGDQIENLSGNENDCDSSRKRKKEKRKSKEGEGNDASKEGNLMEVKKKKKKEKKEKPVENGYCDTEELVSVDCSLEEGEGKLVKKKKKGKTGNEVFGESKKEESIEEASLGEMNDVVKGEDVTAAKGKKKKEKYKDHGENVGVDEPSGKNYELEKVNDFCEGGTLEVGSKKKKKKKEKQEDKVERCSNENGISSDVLVEKCDSGSNFNSTGELGDVKKKKKKKEKGDKTECLSNKNGTPISEKSDGESNSNITVEVGEIKKKKKKKEKRGDKLECHNNENEMSSEIPLEKCDGGKNSNSATELEVEKRKKDKHKTKEEDSGSNCIKEDGLETETVQKKKKKKEKKEKRKSKHESSIDQEEQESKESCPDSETTNAEPGSATKKRKKKEEEEAKGNERERGKGGNAEIGTAAGIDKVELISQRAAYEHVAGQHRHERVKKMMECVHLARFRGSNLEYLDGYGNSSRKCEASPS